MTWHMPVYWVVQFRVVGVVPDPDTDQKSRDRASDLSAAFRTDLKVRPYIA